MFVLFIIMSTISAFFISIMTYVNIGFSEEFFERVVKSLLLATLVMIPLGWSVMYVCNKIVTSLFPNLGDIIQNIMIGILIAIVMEAIMAISTTLNIDGYHGLTQFFNFWFKTYLAALPFALIFSPIMTIFIKPKLEAYLKK